MLVLAAILAWALITGKPNPSAPPPDRMTRLAVELFKLMSWVVLACLTVLGLVEFFPKVKERSYTGLRWTLDALRSLTIFFAGVVFSAKSMIEVTMVLLYAASVFLVASWGAGIALRNYEHARQFEAEQKQEEALGAAISSAVDPLLTRIQALEDAAARRKDFYVDHQTPCEGLCGRIRSRVRSVRECK